MIKKTSGLFISRAEPCPAPADGHVKSGVSTLKQAKPKLVVGAAIKQNFAAPQLLESNLVCLLGKPQSLDQLVRKSNAGPQFFESDLVFLLAKPEGKS